MSYKSVHLCGARGCPKRVSSSFFIFCLFFVINPTNYQSIPHKTPFSTFMSLIIHSLPPFLSLFLLADYFSDVKCNSQYSEVHDNLIQAFMPESLVPFIPFYLSEDCFHLYRSFAPMVKPFW